MNVNYKELLHNIEDVLNSDVYHISYNYEELLQDLEDELNESTIYENSYIQILRSEEPLFSDFDYKPILDYYYDDDTMQMLFTCDGSEDIDEIEFCNEEKAMYLKDKQHLEMRLVSDVIYEMKKMSNPFNRIG